ncbi:MAG: type II toxin-antitoxin system RelE/ParE family toxin [Gammaproteobacteria bacterium]
MRVLFSLEARMEFEEAERYYNRQLAALGAGLREEVRGALRRLRAWPLAFPVESGEIRRALLGRFPYKLLYTIESDHIYILAMAHQHRKPNYWVGRTVKP